MNTLVFIPALAFCLLLAGEAWSRSGRGVGERRSRWDWIIHLSGFAIQGAVVPACGYLLATRFLPSVLPTGEGVLQIGWWGAFLLNFVFVDFLYYWQHRWFHRVPCLWRLHRCHHTARRVDVWVTSRNSLVLHFLFVYFLINPLLGYLVSRPEAFFAGAMMTAALDLFRHAKIDWSRLPGARHVSGLIGGILMLPGAHHRHHGSARQDLEGNFGANLIVWDRLFGTRIVAADYPSEYGVAGPSPAKQWLAPFAPEEGDHRPTTHEALEKARRHAP